jgi:hypothetical protein
MEDSSSIIERVMIMPLCKIEAVVSTVDLGQGTFRSYVPKTSTNSDGV